MRYVFTNTLALLLAACARATVAAPAAAATPAARDSTLDQIAVLVRDKFYSAQLLTQVHWDERVAQAQVQLAHARTQPEREAILKALVASLGTSHTEYIPRTEPKYWDLFGIFEEWLGKAREQCSAEDLPALPLSVPSVGVYWKKLDERWYIGGVYDGGPAQTAQLQLGDELLDADGQPFHPITSFAGKQGKRVVLRYRRERGASPRNTAVVPALVRPNESLREAMRGSARVIEHGGSRIGYVHVWSWAGEDMQRELRACINRLNQARIDGFVLDIRDGWGGASPEYLDVFQREIPVLTVTSRDGKSTSFDNQIRVPAAVLINAGSRSGKEAVAFGVKKFGLAKLIGENTAGAVTMGSPFCLHDGALLYLAVMSVSVDGQTLEGKGVSPDFTVPFDIRHAAGRDAQLEAALDYLRASASALPAGD